MIYLIIEKRRDGGQNAPIFFEANSLEDANDQYAEVINSIDVEKRYDITIYAISDYRQFCSPEKNILFSDKKSPFQIGLVPDEMREILKGVKNG